MRVVRARVRRALVRAAEGRWPMRVLLLLLLLRVVERRSGGHGSGDGRPARQLARGAEFLLLELGLHVDALFEEDALQEGVLVAEHQTLVRGGAVALLQALQRVALLLDGGLELLDVLGAPLAEGGLRLPVALLALLRGSVYLFSFRSR